MLLASLWNFDPQGLAAVGSCIALWFLALLWWKVLWELSIAGVLPGTGSPLIMAKSVLEFLHVVEAFINGRFLLV